MDFLLAVQEGCQLCNMFMTRLHERHPEVDFERCIRDSHEPMKEQGKPTGPFYINFLCVNEGSEGINMHYYKGYRIATRFSGEARMTWKTGIFLAFVSLSEAENGPLAGLQVISASSSSVCTNLKERLSLAVGWIQQCQSHHTECQDVDSGGSNWVPKRLMDTHIPGRPDEFRIVETTSEPLDPCVYATLSHRWGNSDFIRLTTDNSDALHEGRLLTALPKTFQDAVYACRCLDIRWLWIDSLCIIQGGDNGHDWGQQAPQMSSVYGYAICNLAGTEVESAHHGLFRDLDTLLASSIRHHVSLPSYSRIASGEYFIMCPEDFGKRLADAPLNQRGWVFQERLMARRIVHFMSDRIIFECRESVASEAYPKGLAPRRMGINIDVLKPVDAFRSVTPVKAQQTSSDNPGYCRTCAKWSLCISNFTHCALTYPDDRPVAIAGVVNKIKSLSATRCRAGLLSCHFRNSLLWTAYSTGNRAGSPSPPRPVHPSHRSLPSFSWMSTDSLIRSGSGVDEGFEILEADIGEYDIATQTQHGRLMLRGRLLRVRLLHEEINANHGPQWYVARPSLSRDSDGHASYDRLQGRVSRDHHHLGYPFFNEKAEQYMLYVGWNGGNGLLFMLLEAIDSEKGTYRRIGMYLYGSMWLRQEELEKTDRRMMVSGVEEDGRAPGFDVDAEGLRSFCLV